MERSLGKEAIRQAVRLTIEAYPVVVGRWLAGEPGTWGFLAGQAVIACRQQLGRTLTDHERREVWALLWERLTKIKEPRTAGTRGAGGRS